MVFHLFISHLLSRNSFLSTFQMGLTSSFRQPKLYLTPTAWELNFFLQQTAQFFLLKKWSNDRASKGQRHVFENFVIFLKDIFRFKEQNGYLQLNVKLGDKFDIMCPKVKSFAETINPTEPLFLALWNVNRRGFNSCTVDKRTSKRLVRCNVPDYEKKYTLRVKVSFFLNFKL